MLSAVEFSSIESPDKRRDDAHGRKDSNPQLTALETVALARLSYVRVMAYFQQKPPAPNSRTGGCRFARAYPRRRTWVCSSSARCLEKGMVTSPHGMNHCGCPEVDHNTCCSFVERSLTTVRRRSRCWQPGNREGRTSIGSLQCVMFHCGHGCAHGIFVRDSSARLRRRKQDVRQLCSESSCTTSQPSTDWTVKHNRVRNNTKACPADVGPPFSGVGIALAGAERTIKAGGSGRPRTRAHTACHQRT